MYNLLDSSPDLYPQQIPEADPAEPKPKTWATFVQLNQSLWWSVGFCGCLKEVQMFVFQDCCLMVCFSWRWAMFPMRCRCGEFKQTDILNIAVTHVELSQLSGDKDSCVFLIESRWLLARWLSFLKTLEYELVTWPGELTALCKTVQDFSCFTNYI